jgi:nucleoside-diphosphate-sugar epimerase
LRRSTLKITIAGASGFIGKYLIEKILKENSGSTIKGLSRSSKDSDNPRLSWVKSDLFSLGSTVNALSDTDIAIYLVHSMTPTSRLHQASFEDTDLLLADNFARAASKNKVKQIIYLGGLVPEGEISKHLESRREVEEVLKSSGVPVTVLRAGMVVGEGGSSFEILRNLVLNLPAMILPKWTESQTQAIYVDDLVRVFMKVIANKEFYNQTFNVVNGEDIKYKDLITQTIKYFEGKRIYFGVPINSTGFSKLWVTIFGESKYELVSPLIDSLKCDLSFGDPQKSISDCIHFKTYESMLNELSRNKSENSYGILGNIFSNLSKELKLDKKVRSIQRLDNKMHLNSKMVADEYMRWLPQYMGSKIKVTEDENHIYFRLFNAQKPLLILQRVNDSPEDRAKFLIVGGSLSSTSNTGWLEFRDVSSGEFTISALHEFHPSLPWFVYALTQAKLHLRVMNNFSVHLSGINGV